MSYKTTYESTEWGGGTWIGLTIDFVELKKTELDSIYVQWSWDLILDGKEEVYLWREETKKGRQMDGGCYYITKDEYGHKSLDKPVDQERREAIEEYIDEEWPLSKRETYILKKSLSSDTQQSFGDLLDVIS
jgi:hypothetical protein